MSVASMRRISPVLLGCALALAATLGLGATILIRNRQRRRRRDRILSAAQRRMAVMARHGHQGGATVHLVKDLRDWEQVQGKISLALSESRLLGFDCEWVTPQDGGGARPVAMLQLATAQGWCVLVRTCRLPGRSLPQGLASVLEDPGVLKLGVGIQDDARKCLADLDVQVRGFVDLRHLLPHLSGGTKIRKSGLAGLAKAFLGVDLDKDWRIRAGDWECATLSARQLDYAANDALSGVNIGLAMAENIAGERIKIPNGGGDGEEEEKAFMRELSARAYQIFLPFAGVPFKAKPPKPPKASAPAKPGKAGSGGKPAPVLDRKEKLKAQSVRKSPLYHNVRMEAPDGQQLCVCDQKKAEWYIPKRLAEKVGDDPMVIRLKFEPAGRPEGAAGEYYLTDKVNCCVVCGRGESYLRKYVVPHEYRRHFPEIMRDHSSHDVLLMCHSCHAHSNLLDLNLRRELARECGAAIGTEDDLKVREDRDIKDVRSAGRALLKDGSKGSIPPKRKEELWAVLVKFFSVESKEEITEEMMEQAANLDPVILNKEYCPHGKKVVEHFTAIKGVLELEKRWRQHFLDTMNPRFLPPLWSVDHQQERLLYKASINRLDEEDRRIANGAAASE